MHRKFIALILATALTITGLSAAPARADGDTARLFAGLAALALLGAAIQSNRDKHPVTHYYSSPPKHSKPPRPALQPITRRDLPRHCLRTRPVNGGHRKLVGARCLKTNYAFNGSLPYACQLGYSDGNRNRVGYEPLCLRERGYRFVRR